MKKTIQKDSLWDLGSVILRCDDKCGALVIDKMKFPDESKASYAISIQRHLQNTESETFWGRIKAAVKIIKGEPLLYNEIMVDGEHEMVKFRDALSDLIEVNYSLKDKWF